MKTRTEMMDPTNSFALTFIVLPVSVYCLPSVAYCRAFIVAPPLLFPSSGLLSVVYCVIVAQISDSLTYSSLSTARMFWGTSFFFLTRLFVVIIGDFSSTSFMIRGGVGRCRTYRVFSFFSGSSVPLPMGLSLAGLVTLDVVVCSICSAPSKVASRFNL